MTDGGSLTNPGTGRSGAGRRGQRSGGGPPSLPQRTAGAGGGFPAGAGDPRGLRPQVARRPRSLRGASPVPAGRDVARGDESGSAARHRHSESRAASADSGLGGTRARVPGARGARGPAGGRDRHQGQVHRRDAARGGAARPGHPGPGLREPGGAAHRARRIVRSRRGCGGRDLEFPVGDHRPLPGARRGDAGGGPGPPRLASGPRGLPPVQGPSLREPDGFRLGRLRRG